MLVSNLETAPGHRMDVVIDSIRTQAILEDELSREAAARVQNRFRKA